MSQDAKIDDTATKLDVHLAECALRYKFIAEALEKGAKVMDRLQILIALLAAAVLLGPNFMAELLKKFLEH
jgi:hypothetical protein